MPAMQRPRLPSTTKNDFDGDGRADLTVIRAAAAGVPVPAVLRTGYATSGQTQWCRAGDLKVSGDYDGDHKADIAVSPVERVWYIMRLAFGDTDLLQFGLTGDVPVPGTTTVTAAPIRSSPG